MIVVVKIGTSSITSLDGEVSIEALQKLADEVAVLLEKGDRVVVVTSGAVTAGLATLRPPGGRPIEPTALQALSAVGQHRLMRAYDDAFARHGIVVGQVLLAPLDFGERQRYLQARATLAKLFEDGVVAVINENDPIADDEIRFGDNDRLAALVANLIGAQLLVLLTDTDGLYDADPRRVSGASLVEEVREIDAELEAVAGGAGHAGARGGMASKLAAARLASWSGIRVVIAAAHRPFVLADAVAGKPAGTAVMPAARRLSARKAWIAFALASKGTVVIDEGASLAITGREASLLPAGVLSVRGRFFPADAIEIETESGEIVAKGIARLSSEQAGQWLGRRSDELSSELAHELVHRDDLVVLAGAPSRAPHPR